MVSDQDRLEDLLIRAAGATIGIGVETGNPELLRRKLYVARREAGTIRFKDLSFSPGQDTSGNKILFIYKKDQAE